MPTCQDCGNTERFIYEVEGTEVRVFNEKGNQTDTLDGVLETVAGPRCASCESNDVEQVSA